MAIYVRRRIENLHEVPPGRHMDELRPPRIGTQAISLNAAHLKKSVRTILPVYSAEHHVQREAAGYRSRNHTSQVEKPSPSPPEIVDLVFRTG